MLLAGKATVSLRPLSRACQMVAAMEEKVADIICTSAHVKMSHTSSKETSVQEDWSMGTRTPCTNSDLSGSSSEEEAGELVGLSQRRGKINATQIAEQPSSAVDGASPAQAIECKVAARCKSLLPMLFLWAFLAWARYRILGPSFRRGAPERQLRVLVTGGKMSKASAVARAVGRER